MNVRQTWLPMLSLWLAILASAATAAELTTDAERTYRDLRKAKDAQNRLLADRWYNLIRRQEWEDATGQHKTVAKYVEHAPDLEWVKLRIIRGTGDDRVVNDVTIPLEKLSKTCQSRVRQIAGLQERVAAAAQEARKEAEADADGSDMPDATDGRMPPDNESDATSDPSPPAAENAMPAVPPREPLPALPPAIPTSLASEDSAKPAAEGTSADDSASATRPLDPQNPFMPDNDPWRTDYEAFRTAFERDPNGIISTVQRWWGVTELQAAIPNEFLGQDPRDATPKPFVESRRAREIGDFVWQATVVKQPTAGGNLAEAFDLPPLPEPLKLELRPTSPDAERAWMILSPGDQVKFLGRFTGYKGAYTWVAEITAADASFEGDLTRPDSAEDASAGEPLAPPPADSERPVE